MPTDDILTPDERRIAALVLAAGSGDTADMGKAEWGALWWCGLTHHDRAPYPGERRLTDRGEHVYETLRSELEGDGGK